MTTSKQDLIRRLYFNDWVRIPVKFILMCTAIKVGYDFFEYRTAWRTHAPNPRSCAWDQQCPTNPPLVVPYRHYSTYEQYKEIKYYHALQNGYVKGKCNYVDKAFVLCDAPCRENVNSIDRLFLRAKEHASSEKSKFYFLNELAKQEGSVPQGVYSEIRKGRQSELEVESTLVPQL